MKMECIHADTCLSDYWSGHHLAHIQILAERGMTIDQLKRALNDQLAYGGLGGSDEVAQLLNGSPPPYASEEDQRTTYDAAEEAIGNIELKEGVTTLFNDLEQSGDGSGDSDVYAYFVLREVEA